MSAPSPAAAPRATKRHHPSDDGFRSDGDAERWATCYHEAGHVVFAYDVGWWVDYEGVEVGIAPFTGLGCRGIDDTPWRRIWVNLGGIAAETRFLNAPPVTADDDLADVLAAVRADKERTGDEGEVFRALIEQYPEADETALIAAFLAYQREIAQLIATDDRLWDRIERIARALWQRGRLTADEVEGLLA